MTATDPTRVYQAQGYAAVTDALALNGPIAPVPYYPSATQRREQTNDRVYAGRVAFIDSCHLPTATPTRTYLRHVLTAK